MGLIDEVQLTNAEKTACTDVFRTLDLSGSGTLTHTELKKAFESLGQHPTDDDIQSMIFMIDTDESGEVELWEFMSMVAYAKSKTNTADNDDDTLAAFVAIGGNTDGTGQISVDKLVNTLAEFELAVDLNGMLQEVDQDKSGQIDFSEFKTLLAA